MWADGLTGPTPDASPGLEHNFLSHGLALGVMTPPAIKRTALEENRGANPGPVVDGKLLYVEYYPCIQTTSARFSALSQLVALVTRDSDLDKLHSALMGTILFIFPHRDLPLTGPAGIIRVMGWGTR